MERVFKVLLFTDLDGSLLHRETIKFDEIKDYLIEFLKTLLIKILLCVLMDG